MHDSKILWLKYNSHVSLWVNFNTIDAQVAEAIQTLIFEPLISSWWKAVT